MSNNLFLGIVSKRFAIVHLSFAISLPRMKKILLIFIPIVLAVIIFLLFTLLLPKDDGRGALQVTAVPQSTVYLNGKRLGKTPLCACGSPSKLNTLVSGDYTFRLVPQESSLLPYEDKIHITTGVMTVVDRTAGKGATSEGSILTLIPLKEKNAREISVLSFPQKAQVLIDDNDVGQTPIIVKKITESDHEIKIKKSGYNEKIIRVRAVTGYRLEAATTLGVSDIVGEAIPTEKVASPTATLSPIPSTVGEKVVILDTPVGYLRVRESGSLNAGEIGKVIPGETYELVDEQEGWYKIKLITGKLGWINSQYAQKQ